VESECQDIVEGRPPSEHLLESTSYKEMTV
jgi:hypothetical protein